MDKHERVAPFGAELMVPVTGAAGNLACLMDVESTEMDDVNVPPPPISIPVMPPDLFPSTSEPDEKA